MKRSRWILSAAVLLAAGLLVTGCKDRYKSTSEVSLSGQDIVYLKDDRTSLCFAVLAVQNPLGTKIRQVTMTRVPCENLQSINTR